MIILVIALWIALAVATVVTIYTWKSNGQIERVCNIIAVVLLLGFTILITNSFNTAIQYQGIDKYLDKEVVIQKIKITYDAEYNPIDTTYYYARNRNESQSKE